MLQNRPTKKANKPGSKFHAEFLRVETPHPHIKLTGKTDFQAYIQSFQESTDYTTILEKMVKGDPVATAQAVNILAGSNRQAVPDYVDDSVNIDLRTVASSVYRAADFYQHIGGKEKTGRDFIEFCRDLEGFVPVVEPEKQPEPAPAES